MVRFEVFGRGRTIGYVWAYDRNHAITVASGVWPGRVVGIVYAVRQIVTAGDCHPVRSYPLS